MTTRYSVDKFVIKQHEYFDAPSSPSRDMEALSTAVAILNNLLILLMASAAIYYSAYGAGLMLRKVYRFTFRRRNNAPAVADDKVANDIEAQTPPPELSYDSDSSLPCSPPSFSSNDLKLAFCGHQPQQAKNYFPLNYNDDSIKIH